jgi:nucleoside-diphosphate-sugar epimerase
LVDRALEDGMERIVHLSTTALFDPSGRTVADEDTPLVAEGADTYALSKTAPEKHLRKLQDEGAPISIVYPPGVIGPNDPGLSEAMKGIQQFLQASVLITSSGFQMVDVRDLATLHVTLIEREPAVGRFIASARFLDWEELADLLDAAAGIRLRRLQLPGRAVRLFGRLGDRLRPFVDIDPSLSREATRLATQWVAFDASRAESTLGVKFRDPIETLFDTVKWLAAEGHVDADRALRFTHPGRGRN